MMCLAGFVFVYPSDQIFIDSFFILDVLKLFKVERILKIKFQLLCKDNRNINCLTFWTNSFQMLLKCLDFVSKLKF